MDKKKQKDLQPTPPPVKGELRWVLVLNVITGKGAEEKRRTFQLNKKRIVIGSALSSDVRIEQNSVSNVHAVIELDDQGKGHIYDMMSETGVFVNGNKIVTTDLKDGDEIKVGFASLAFRVMPLSEVQKAVPPQRVRSSGARKLFYNEKEDFRPLILEDERNVIQIFDYPGAADRALQVVMYWGDVLLNVKHFAEVDQVTMGDSQDADFLVPGLPSKMPLVSVQNSDVVIHVSPDMRGVIRSRQGLRGFDEVRKERGSSALIVNLKEDDLAKVQVGEITFFLSYSPMPPHLRGQRVLERDPLFTRIWFTSLALTAALVVLAITAKTPEPLPVEELPPQVTAIIFRQPLPPPPVVKKIERKEPPKETPKEPEKKPPPPKKKVEVKVTPKHEKAPIPKKLPTEVKHAVKAAETPHLPQHPHATAQPRPKTAPARPAGGDQGAGAKAAGPSGAKGKTGAQRSPVHQSPSRGTPAASSLKKGATGKGSVESFFGDISGSISKNIAAGAKGASSAAERITGYGGQATEGVGGLGEVGEGRGGGGKSLDVAGAGTSGVGEGAIGKGKGAIGSGGNFLGTGRGRPEVAVGGGEDTVVMGGLSKDVIAAIIEKYKPQIRHCYEMEANRNPGLGGRVATRFEIAPSGRVSHAGVESTSLRNAAVERCLVGVLKVIQFPEPAGGGVVDVTYPFDFRTVH